MKNRKFILVTGCVCLSAFFSAGPGRAAEPLKLTVQTAVEMAFAASEDLKISENDILKKESERKAERAAALPQVMGEVGWSNNFEFPDLPATTYTKEYHMNAGITVSQALFTFGRISASIQAAAKDAEVSRFNKDGTRQEIIYNTKLAYYNAYFARRIFEIAGESYDNARQNKAILEEQSQQGRVSKYNNIKISADLASRMPAVNNARADFLSSMETLKVVVGTDEAIELLDGFGREYPDFDREDLALALYHNQPAIKALAADIEVKASQIRAKTAAVLPEVSAFVSWNHKGDSADYYVGGDNMDGYGVAGIQVNVPLWLGGISREKLRQAKLDKRDAELQYRKGQEDYLLLLDKSLNQYNEYKKTLKANEEAVRWAEESFKYSQELFGSGQVSVTDLNDAELQLTNAKMNKETTLFNLNMILAQIERLTLTGSGHE